MTDQEILDLALFHASSFTSCIQFTDQDLINFARAVLNETSTIDSSKKIEEKHPYQELMNDVEELYDTMFPGDSN